MFEKETQMLNEAYEAYNLDTRENLEDDILNYIRERIVENLDLLEEIILYTGEEITPSDILATFDQESNIRGLYKKQTNITRLENNFVYGEYITSCGNIAVECSDTLKTLRYFVKAIKTRNTITISDVDYDELNVKTALLVIFCEALAKFNVDRNLIMIVPFEECYYDNFDKVIYLDEDKKPHIKAQTNKFFIYLEDESLRNYVEKEEEVLKYHNKNYEILTGDFYEVINKINKEIPLAVAIYTKDQETAYKFINLVHSKNIFFNTSFVETEFIEDPKDILYMRKKIMYPLENADNSLNTDFKIPQNREEVKEEVLESPENKNLQLIPKQVNPWYKRIFECIKRFFKR